MLARLYDLPDHSTLMRSLEASGIRIRRALAVEKSLTLDWVAARIGRGWASEADVAFSCHPVSCLIAVRNAEILGFACYDACYRNFFGPTGVGRPAGGSASARPCSSNRSSACARKVTPMPS